MQERPQPVTNPKADSDASDDIGRDVTVAEDAQRPRGRREGDQSGTSDSMRGGVSMQPFERGPTRVREGGGARGARTKNLQP
jgi:hypothetical protein